MPRSQNVVVKLIMTLCAGSPPEAHRSASNEGKTRTVTGPNTLKAWDNGMAIGLADRDRALRCVAFRGLVRS